MNSDWFNPFAWIAFLLYVPRIKWRRRKRRQYLNKKWIHYDPQESGRESSSGWEYDPDLLGPRKGVPLPYDDSKIRYTWS